MASSWPISRSRRSGGVSRGMSKGWPAGVRLLHEHGLFAGRGGTDAPFGGGNRPARHITARRFLPHGHLLADVARSFQEARPIESLRAAAGYAAEKGTQLTTENHGGYFALSPRLEHLFEAVNHPNFGLLCDIGNFQDADEKSGRAMDG